MAGERNRTAKADRAETEEVKKEARERCFLLLSDLALDHAHLFDLRLL
jgi:hypothetical protein